MKPNRQIRSNRPMLLTLALSLVSALPACEKEDGQTPGTGEDFLRMTLNEALALDLKTDESAPEYQPVLAFVTTGDVTGPDGELFPANTLGISARAAVDVTFEKSKVLSISLNNVTESGTYDILEHGGIIVYVDASKGGTTDLEQNTSWTAGVDKEGSHGTVTITEIGDEAVPGLGRPVKGSFEIHALGGQMQGGDPDADELEGLLKGEFSWGF